MSACNELFFSTLGEHCSILEARANQKHQVVVVHVDGIVDGSVGQIELAQKVTLILQVMVQGFLCHLQAKLYACGSVPIPVDFGLTFEVGVHAGIVNGRNLPQFA